MTQANRPTFLRRKLGAKLRRMREQAGLTLDQAAPRLDKKRSTLHRLETGETMADVHLVRSMMDFYNIFDPTILDETREARKPPWYRAYGLKNAGYTDLETEAAALNQVQLVGIPGLLQTRAYMRALFKTGPKRSRQQLANDMEVRRIRQKRLTSADRPLNLVTIIYEAALHRVVESQELMREQLLHLVEMAALPTVTLQVIPLQGGSFRMPNSPYNLLSFPDPEDPEVLYIEHSAGAMVIEDPEEVREARLAFEQLRIDALTPADSVALIERLASEM